MSHVIYKKPLSIDNSQQIHLPVGSEILCVQVQMEIPCIWYRFKKGENETHPVTIKTYPTGHDIPVQDGPITEAYLGTYQLYGGAIVHHVYLGGYYK